MPNLSPPNERLALSYGVFSGLALASVTSGLGVQLVNALIIGVVSALIAAVGTVVGATVAARITREEAQKTRKVVHDVKEKIGAARRETDHPPE